jgi:hypothetical protein
MALKMASPNVFLPVNGHTPEVFNFIIIIDIRCEANSKCSARFVGRKPFQINDITVAVADRKGSRSFVFIFVTPFALMPLETN